LKKVLKFGVSSLLGVTLLSSGLSIASAEESTDLDKKLWDSIPSYSSSTAIKDDEVHADGSGSLGTVGSGSTSFAVTESLVTAQGGYPVRQVKSTGKTTSKVITASHGVTTTLLLNGSSIGSKHASGIGKKTDTITVSHNPGSVKPGWQYRAKSHHTLTTANRTYVADTGAIKSF